MTDLSHSGYKESFLPFGDPAAQDPDPEVRKRFFGLYRGTVKENVDPLLQGRLLVQVPDTYGMLPGTWAMPCVPMAGPKMGTSFMPPPVGSSVWVMFEQGDPQMPVWVGCYWGTPDVPIPPDGNVLLYADEGAVSVALSPAGVVITAPTVSIVTPSFTINGVQFAVT
jgi:hypothetical protein